MSQIAGDPGPGTTTPQRHGCLTAILLVFAVLSALAAVSNLALHNRLAGNLPNAPGWASQGVIAVGVLGVIMVAALVALWFWKRWGLYLYILAGIVVFLINIQLVGPLPSVLGLIGLALVSTFVIRQWRDFH